MSSVLQPWVEELPWKMQSVLIASLRGPDTDKCPRIKGISRWMRKVCQYDADPGTGYMKDNLGPFDEELKLEIGFCTLHFFSHFLHGLETIGYKHPDKTIRGIAEGYYYDLVAYLHLSPERERELDGRLRKSI